MSWCSKVEAAGQMPQRPPAEFLRAARAGHMPQRPSADALASVAAAEALIGEALIGQLDAKTREALIGFFNKYLIER